MRWGRTLVIGLVLAAVVGLAPATAWSEAVGIRAAKRADYGRIVFRWERPVAHRLSHDGRTLTIHFGRPIEATYQRVLGALSDYVSRVRVGRDGHSVSFDLTGTYETYGFDSGNAVIVEIARIAEPPPPPVPEQATAAVATSAPQAAAQSVAVADAPSIRVRTGAHGDYTRIVFDWTEKVDYTVSQSDGVVTVQFAAPAQLQLAALQNNPPAFVGGVRSRVGDKQTTVTLAVPATSTVKHFLSGPKVVLDIQQPSGSEEIAALPPEAPEASDPPENSETPPPAAASADDGEPAPAPATAPEKGDVERQPLPDAATAAAAAAPPEAAVGTAAGTDAASAAAAQATESAAPAPAAAPAAPAVESGQPVALRPVAVQRAPASPDEDPNGDDEATEGGAPPAPAAAAGAGVRFKFDWDEPVAAAVFRRVGFIWLIFDKAGTIDVQALLRQGGNIIQSIDQAPSSTATVLRMRVTSQINPRLSRDGLSWIVEFNAQEPSVATPIEINAQPDSPVGARVFLPVPEPGQPVGITDPAVGDNLVVVPVIPLGHGVRQGYTYSQLKVLPSAQGIVVQPLVDDLRVRPLRQGVELTSGGALALSPVSADVAASAKLAANRPLTKLLELDKWELASISKFMERRRELQNEIAAARGDQREIKRFNLARFYFANRFAAEAMGVLAQMQIDRPEIENEPEFRLIRGGSSFLMARMADAAADLTHASLDGQDEANLWRAAVVFESGDKLAAAPALVRAGVLTQKYPRALKILMGTIVAEAAVELGDIKTARDFLDALKTLEPGEAQLAGIEYVEGRLLNLGGDTDGAITKWEAVQEMRNRAMRAKATVARMELLLKLRRITNGEAIEELERLRFAWRGDEFEFAMLRRLGGLYLDEGVYRNGLQALRQAATYFREHEAAPQITQQMADVFNTLYLDDGADSMPAVTAIAVYEEFKELTPAGARGDEMIRKLADRLAAVDLLDQAAEILEGQVRFRLNGTLKSEVGARLAIVYLLARRYDRALAALDETNVPNQPEALSAQRRHLRARALMSLDQRDAALEILKADKAPDADLLRAEMFWRIGDWNNAAKELRKIVRDSGAKKNEPVSPDQAQKVLNYAVALVLSGNERGLARVRTDYGRAIQSTPLKDAFQLVSAPTALGLISPGTVSSRVKLAENFKTFLSEYKKRLQEKGLSGLTAQKTADAGTPPAQSQGS